MKLFLKRCMGLVLAFVLLASSVLPASAETNTDKVITVYCVANSYNSPNATLDLLIRNGETYIEARNAAIYTNYLYEDRGIPSYLKQGDVRYYCTEYALYGNKKWVPLEKTLEELGASVQLENYILWIDAKQYSFEDLRSITSRLVTNNNSLKNLFSGGARFAAEAGYILIQVASGNAVSVLWEKVKAAIIEGKISAVDEKYYKNMVQALLQPKEKDIYITNYAQQMNEDNETLKIAAKIAGCLKPIKKLVDFYGELTKDKVFASILEETKGSDAEELEVALIVGKSAFDFWSKRYKSAKSQDNILADVLGSLNNPFGTLLKKYEEKNLKGIKIGGMDVASQLSVAQNMYIVGNASKLCQNMFYYTYYGSNKKKAPANARFAIESVLSATSKGIGDNVWNIIVTELEMIVGKTFTGSLEELFEESNVFYLYEIGGAIVGTISDWTANSASKADFIQESFALAEIQESARNLYNKYISNEKTAINAKYAAMLYIRCADVAVDLIDKLDETNTSRPYNSDMLLLTRISDYDLSREISNSKINIEELYTAAEICGKNPVDDFSDGNSAMELSQYVGTDLEVLKDVFPDLRYNPVECTFEADNKSVSGSGVHKLTSISTYLNVNNGNTAFNYSIFGVRLGMSYEQAVNILSEAGFVMQSQAGGGLAGANGRYSLLVLFQEDRFVSGLRVSVSDMEDMTRPDLLSALGMTLEEFRREYPEFVPVSNGNFYEAYRNGKREAYATYSDLINPPRIDNIYINDGLFPTYSFGDATTSMTFAQIENAWKDKDLKISEVAAAELYRAEKTNISGVVFFDKETEQAIGYQFSINDIQAYEPRDLAYYMIATPDDFRNAFSVEIETEKYNQDSFSFIDEVNGIRANARYSTNKIWDINLEKENHNSLFGVKPGMHYTKAISALKSFNDYGLSVKNVYYADGKCDAEVYSSKGWLADIHFRANNNTVTDISATVTEGDAEDYPEDYPEDEGGSIAWTPLYTAIVVNCENWVSLREDPDSKSYRLHQVPRGAKVDVYDIRDDGFTYCMYMGEVGYILSKYLAKEGTLVPVVPQDTYKSSNGGYVKAFSHKVNLRDAPNLSGKDIGTMKDGQTATYLGKKSTDSRGVVWYKVSFSGKTGWVSSKYTKLYN